VTCPTVLALQQKEFELFKAYMESPRPEPYHTDLLEEKRQAWIAVADMFKAKYPWHKIIAGDEGGYEGLPDA